LGVFIFFDDDYSRLLVEVELFILLIMLDFPFEIFDENSKTIINREPLIQGGRA